jgi:hypothetical protein
MQIAVLILLLILFFYVVRKAVGSSFPFLLDLFSLRRLIPFLFFRSVSIYPHSLASYRPSSSHRLVEKYAFLSFIGFRSLRLLLHLSLRSPPLFFLPLPLSFLSIPSL